MEHNQISSYPVSRETFSRVDQLIDQFHSELQTYMEQLLWWNERINLVSRDVSRETVWEHIRHSLLLSQFKTFKNNSIIIDAGTGGGLPGIPLAITNPEKHFVLNDLVTKKCMALKQIAKKLELSNIGIIDGSIEEFSYDESFLLVSKHAFAIDRLYKMTASLPWSSMVFYKGTDVEKELDGIPDEFEITVHDLSGESTFYDGKALIFVNR